jgi:hypothetical protein
VSVAGSSCRWAILAVCVAGFMQTPVHRVGDLTGSFPAAFTACAVFEAVALAIAMFARETGRRSKV